MKKAFQLTVLVIVLLLSISNSFAQSGCVLPFERETADLTRSEQSIMSFTSDVDRVVFRIGSHGPTNSLATLSVFVDGVLKKGVAIKKGPFSTSFALRGLSDKHVEVKGSRASATNKRRVVIEARKRTTWLSRWGNQVKESETVLRIPRGGTLSIGSLAACNGKAQLKVRVTNSNTANLTVRVREKGGPVIANYSLGGNAKNFVRTVNSDKELLFEFTNTSPNMRKDIRVSVLYTNSNGFSLSNG